MFPKYKSKCPHCSSRSFHLIILLSYWSPSIDEELAQFRSRRDKILKQREKENIALSLPLSAADEQARVSSLSIMTERSPSNSSSSSSAGATPTTNGGNSGVGGRGGSGENKSMMNESRSRGPNATASIGVSVDFGPGFGRVRSLPIGGVPASTSATDRSFASAIPSPDSPKLKAMALPPSGSSPRRNSGMSVRKASGAAITVPLLTLDGNSSARSRLSRAGINNNDQIDDNDDYLDNNSSDGSSNGVASPKSELREPLLSPVSLHAAALMNDSQHHQLLPMAAVSSPSGILGVHIDGDGINGNGSDRGLSDAECDQRRALYTNWTHDNKANEFEAELSREVCLCPNT
jgi:hypothetical protein